MAKKAGQVHLLFDICQDDERRWSDRRGSRQMENDLTVIAVCRSEERQAANKKVT